MTIPRTDPALPDLNDLSDGQITVSGAYAPVNGGQSKQIRKDTAAPVLSADPAPGTYTGLRGIALQSNGGETIRYTTDGFPPNNNSKIYDGQRIQLGFGTHTIRAFSTDGANNRTDATFNYTLNRPAPGASALSLNVAKTSLKLGTSRLISGRLTPAHASNPVRVTIKRNG